MYELLDGAKTAKQRRQDVAHKVAQLKGQGVIPKLSVIRVGNDPASIVYIGIKTKVCKEVGIETDLHELPAETSEEELYELISGLNQDPLTYAILLQLPLPKHLDAATCVNFIAANKDVDGLTKANADALASGKANVIPCTPLGVMNLLATYDINPRGKTVAIVGRSQLVGTPLRHLMEQAGATVNVVHSQTQNPYLITQRADIVVSAAGVAHLVQPEWVKDGAIVVDVGISRQGDMVTGDVDFEKVAPKCAYISPVPGGVGPMTVQTLLENVLTLVRLRAS